jgi:hypothetical protein
LIAIGPSTAGLVFDARLTAFDHAFITPNGSKGLKTTGIAGSSVKIRGGYRTYMPGSASTDVGQRS